MMPNADEEAQQQEHSLVEIRTASHFGRCLAVLFCFFFYKIKLLLHDPASVLLGIYACKNLHMDGQSSFLIITITKKH
jgi:hypothetical protein